MTVRDHALELNGTRAIRLIHGSADRVTSHLGTLRLFDRLPNEDKEVEIYPGLEHGKRTFTYLKSLLTEA